MRKSIIIEKTAPTSLKATLNVGAVCNGKVKDELLWQADAKSGLLGGKNEENTESKRKDHFTGTGGIYRDNRRSGL